MGGVRRGARVGEFNFFFVGGGGGGGLELVNFFFKESKSNKRENFFGFGSKLSQLK